MATKIKLDQGIYLTPLNSESLLEIQDNLEARCFMCREILTNENKTVEHIYPKWLQKHCGLWDQKITLLIICALDSFNFFNLQYQEEVHILDSLEIVHPLQGLELFAKMVYYKTHYKFDTEHKVIIDASGPYIENKILPANSILKWPLKALCDKGFLLIPC